MKYQLVNQATKNAMRLQSIGFVLGTQAKEVKVGDSLMWNFGSKSNVLEIVKETAKTIIFKTVGENGYIGERRLKKDRLVCKLEK
jgi:hypothetical protein|tara:strand:- start:326 stop:580 length:255 start_codon:yes stop_codon:yes gene_type:complete